MSARIERAVEGACSEGSGSGETRRDTLKYDDISVNRASNSVKAFMSGERKLSSAGKSPESSSSDVHWRGKMYMMVA